MVKRILALAAFAALLFPAASQAVDHTGAWGVGYYDENAPIGLRYQFGEKAAFDFGLGFSSFEGPDEAEPGETKNFLIYNIEAGVPLTLVKTERADFFFRPGVLWSSIPYQLDNGVDPVSDERVSDLTFKLHLGAEWHATDNLSLSVGHGFNILSTHGVDAGDDLGGEPESSTSWGTEGFDITQIGFRWYFGGGM
jgi:hypothetical protein